MGSKPTKEEFIAWSYRKQAKFLESLGLVFCQNVKNFKVWDTQECKKIYIPVDKSFSDYYRRMNEVIEEIVASLNQNPFDTLEQREIERLKAHIAELVSALQLVTSTLENLEPIAYRDTINKLNNILHKNVTKE